MLFKGNPKYKKSTCWVDGYEKTTYVLKKEPAKKSTSGRKTTGTRSKSGSRTAASRNRRSR